MLNKTLPMSSGIPIQIAEEKKTRTLYQENYYNEVLHLGLFILNNAYKSMSVCQTHIHILLTRFSSIMQFIQKELTH